MEHKVKKYHNIFYRENKQSRFMYNTYFYDLVNGRILLEGELIIDENYRLK